MHETQWSFHEGLKIQDYTQSTTAAIPGRNVIVYWIPGIMKGKQCGTKVSEVILFLQWSWKALSHLSAFIYNGMCWGSKYECSQKAKVHLPFWTITLAFSLTRCKQLSNTLLSQAAQINFYKKLYLGACILLASGCVYGFISKYSHK